MSQRQAEHGRKIPRCPICGQPRVQAFRPFCSARCRDLDLARWFNQTYAIPVVEPGHEDEAPLADLPLEGQEGGGAKT